MTAREWYAASLYGQRHFHAVGPDGGQKLRAVHALLRGKLQWRAQRYAEQAQNGLPVEYGISTFQADGIGLTVGNADKVPDIGDRAKHDGYFIHGDSS